MLKRKLYDMLLQWKNADKRRPLLIRGARQVGKTYLVNEFGKKEFKSFIIINFERNPEYKDIFLSYNPAEIIERISLLTAMPIVPNETLLFFDEIQECPKAIMALRYFYEEMPDLHIISAGSLLEFSLNKEDFRMPVGRVQYLYMYPLSFGEFLEAMGESILHEHITLWANLKKLPDAVHQKLIEYLRKYFILGGMPAVVDEYVRSHDILKCQQIQHLLIETFIDDFSKYARKSKFKYLKKVFAAASSMVGNKFVYSKVDKDYKSRELKEAVDLLETAGLLYRVKRTSGAGLPLEASVKENYFKTVFLDIGLMHAINGIYSETIKETDLTVIYKGAVAEQFVGQQLCAYNNPYLKASLYFWVREAKNSNAEVDYLLEKDGAIVPLEVKSGSNGRLKSIKMFMEKYGNDRGVKISQEKFNDSSNILSLPFYGMEVFFNKK
jgi:predicted AAA+ superfamily ATPase